MIDELVEAENKYYREIKNTFVDIDRALRMNRLYCNKLFEFYHSLKDPEEKKEIEHEIDYLIEQARALEDFKINEQEEKT